jgi:hypothetical protein
VAILEVLRDVAREAPLRLRLAGQCMAPALEDGRSVDVVATRRYWPGDVVVFARRDGTLVAHRLLGIRPGRPWLAFTQADRSATPDSAVALHEIVGRVVVDVRVADRLRALGRFASLVLQRLQTRLA